MLHSCSLTWQERPAYPSEQTLLDIHKLLYIHIYSHNTLYPHSIVYLDHTLVHSAGMRYLHIPPYADSTLYPHNILYQDYTQLSTDLAGETCISFRTQTVLYTQGICQLCAFCWNRSLQYKVFYAVTHDTVQGTDDSF